MRKRPVALSFALASALALSPRATPAQGYATLSAVEHALGASPLNAMAGHGRLSVGVTRDSDVAVLTWPTPSCCDQLTHLASNEPDARSRPRTGVREGFGIALGMVIRVGAVTRVAWFHDPAEWTATQRYASDDALQPHTELTHTTLGLRVTVDDAVLPDRDVLQRTVTVTRAAGSTVTSVALLTHANLGLTQNVVPRLPLGDVVADSRNDFGAVWDADLGAAVHFRPADRAPVTDLIPLVMPAPLPVDHFGPLDALMRDAGGTLVTEAAALSRGLDTQFGPGVYAVLATEPRAEQFHIGREGDAFCAELGRLVDNVRALASRGLSVGIDPSVAENFRCPPVVLPANVATAREWTRVIPSAWEDARDGELAGNPVAAYLSDSAQRTAMDFAAGNSATARVFIAFGTTAAEARATIVAARALGADALAQRDRDAWVASTGAFGLPDTLPARIPADDRARIQRAARRAMLHLVAGTDRATGAIVASIARQAPYGLDWPRDGAFFDYALDVAGAHEPVTRRLAWMLPLARATSLTQGQINPLTDPLPPIDPRNGRRQYPEAAWEMNYYNTGAMGGFFRFEIDNTAFNVWSAAVHVGYVPAAERRALAERYWPTVRRSTELLATWRDANTGLNAPANEDDNAAFTSGLHGGTAVFAALEGAARLARLLDQGTDAARWEHRAAELRDVLVARFYDRAMNRFLSEPEGAAVSNPGSAGLGPTAWLVWPARLLPYSDPRVAAQVRYDLEQVLAQLRGAPGTEGGAYLTKTTLSSAIYLANGGDVSLQPLLDEAVSRLARDIISQDTQVMGEVFITRRNADGTVAGYENRVSIPHLWEATLFYLTTMAMAHPERFELDRAALPANQTPAPGVVGFTPPVRDAGALDASNADAGIRLAGGGACECSAPGGERRGAGGRAASAVTAAVAVVVGMRQRRRARRV